MEGGVERSHVHATRKSLRSDRRWREGSRVEPNRSQPEARRARWRGVIAGGGERSRLRVKVLVLLGDHGPGDSC